MSYRLQSIDFVDTRAIGAGDVVMAMPCEHADALDPLAAAERADWGLLKLVLCTGTATLVLALAASLGR